MKKNERGITLIALVVTIVVLLILAGVSISMLTGENGIITQARKAKLENRAGTVEEEVGLWRNENQIRKNNNEEKISKETLLQQLKDKALVEEDEIDREREVITIGEREISYADEEEKKDYYIEGGTSIILIDKDTNNPTTFSQAFIVYNDEVFEITDLIKVEDGYNYLWANDIRNKVDIDIYESGETKDLKIIKDGNTYEGNVVLSWPL